VFEGEDRTILRQRQPRLSVTRLENIDPTNVTRGRTLSVARVPGPATVGYTTDWDALRPI